MALRLTTLGRTALLDDETGTELPLHGGRLLAIVIHLALHTDRPCPREAVAAAVWEERVSQPRANLRTNLWRLRRHLPEGVLVEDASGLSLQGVAVDAVEFEQAVADERYEDAVGLYRGEFLQDFTPPNSSTFNQWTDGVRQRIRRLFRRAALAESDRLAAAAEWKKALALLTRLGQSDPEDLEVRLREVQMLFLAGFTSAAADAARELQVDLASHPDSDTEVVKRLEDLLVRLDREGMVAARPEPAGVDAPRPRPSRLVGRSHEFGLLADAWRRARGGAGSTILVRGDSGIGKTRLIEEVLRVARVDGGTVLETRGFRFERALPYAVVGELLRQVQTAPGFMGVSQTSLRLLASVAPGLAEAGRLSATVVSEDEAPPPRIGLCEAVADVLEALAFEASVVVAIDDLQWVDRESQEMLHYLSRTLCDASVLILAGMRLGEDPEGPSPIDEALLADCHASMIDLGALQREEVQEMLASMEPGPDPSPALLDCVWKASEGVPFFVISTVDALIDHDALRIEEDGWYFRAARVPEALRRLPERAQGLLRARLDLLTEDSLALLQAAAVVGRRFTAETLRSLEGRADSEVARCLVELVRRRFIASFEDPAGVTYDFTHDLIRQAVFQEVPTPRRSLLLDRAGETTGEWAGISSSTDGISMGQESGIRTPDRVPATTAAPATEDNSSVGTLPVRASTRPAWLLGSARRRRALLAIVGASAILTSLFSWEYFQRARADSQSHGNLIEGAAGSGGSPVSPTVVASIPAAERWTPVGIRIEHGDRLTMTASGWVAFDTDGGTAGPEGSGRGVGWRGAVLRGAPLHALVCRIAEGAPFFVGARTTMHAQASGELRCQINEPQDDVDVYLDNSGAWTLAVHRDHPAILFVSERDGCSRVYVMNEDGSGVTKLSLDPCPDVEPAWSPDGMRVAFTSYREGDGEILLMDPDGSNTSKVTDNDVHDRSPTWSPDGTRIAFVSERDGNPEIYVMGLDGSAVSRLTDDPGMDEAPAWSPDGRMIAFSSDRGGNPDIYAVELGSGRAPVRLTTDPADDRDPAWSPDGRWLAFASNRLGTFDIFLLSVTDRSLLRLTRDPGDESYPAWSTDGLRIAFNARRDGAPDIFTVSVEGGELSRVTSHPAHDYRPDWR